MASDTERILSAVQCVDSKVATLDSKVGKLDVKVSSHLAYHKGREKGEKQTSERGSMVRGWIKTGLAVLAIVATAVVFVMSAIGAVAREPADEVRELRARMDKVIFKLDHLARSGSP